MNAYAIGQRKRRKIHDQRGLMKKQVRWHRTGKTKPVMEDGVGKGFKKIMVLYVRSKNEKGPKPYKPNWVTCHYHLGTEDEKDSVYVVSKLYYQQKQTKKDEENPVVEDSNNMTSQTSPRTPKPNPSIAPHPGKSVDYDDYFEEYLLSLLTQDAKSIPGKSQGPSDIQGEEDPGNHTCLAGESQAVENSDFDGLDDILLCKENFDSSSLLNNFGLDSTVFNSFASNTKELAGNENASYEISDLADMYFDSQPDFLRYNLQHSYQDSSILDWVNKLQWLLGKLLEFFLLIVIAILLFWPDRVVSTITLFAQAIPRCLLDYSFGTSNCDLLASVSLLDLKLSLEDKVFSRGGVMMGLGRKEIPIRSIIEEATQGRGRKSPRKKGPAPLQIYSRRRIHEKGKEYAEPSQHKECTRNE